MIGGGGKKGKGGSIIIIGGGKDKKGGGWGGGGKLKKFIWEISVKKSSRKRYKEPKNEIEIHWD